MLAENINISFPGTFWAASAYEAPHTRPSTLHHPPSSFGPRAKKGTELIVDDDQHIIVSRNTEYEIFSIGAKRHTLGAVSILNHKTTFEEGHATRQADRRKKRMPKAYYRISTNTVGRGL
ncbi:MAG: hypothetical protein M2R45_03892 [Verrucomicrobia subdivision 3 bacterium]|nr:hypothetical protein [Limisphaerales bacterium]MCS1412595.1 hypothetical protein [Limisphaerales bacterium]